MLDHSSKPRWQNSLQRGDVVLFRFPVSDVAGAPRPKARPCLVLERSVQKGTTLLKLAYGTSAMTRANRGHEVRVNRADSMRAAGLQLPTRFVAARAIVVTTDHTGFDIGPIGSPLIGRLDPNLFERMNCIRLSLASKGFTWCNTRATPNGTVEACGFLDRNRISRGTRTGKGNIK